MTIFVENVIGNSFVIYEKLVGSRIIEENTKN